MTVTVVEQHPDAKLLRLHCTEWKPSIERNREKRPGCTIELFVRPKWAPEPTADKRGRRAKPHKVTVHT